MELEANLKDTEVVIKNQLGGITAGKDAKAIVAWIKLLNNHANIYGSFKRLSHVIQSEAKFTLERALTTPELMISLNGILTTTGHRSNQNIENCLRDLKLTIKLPGMGHVLGSEFFRNLGWPGFKPDRHIKRLFEKWHITASTSIDRAVADLSNLTGIRRSDFREYAKTSLMGIELTPEDMSYSATDNWLWLLGAYVEKKNKKTDTQYLN